MLIGTAGHVNHGKTSLVHALTGTDTDRLPEEKRRGLSIDLGFAYAERPDGQVIGFVDVPGHDRYLHNMISGVLPLDAVLLIVAADEGPKEQTAQHIEILSLAGVEHLSVAITKIDRADDAQISKTEARLRDHLRGTAFADTEMFRVSTQTGAGLDRLRGHLNSLCVDAHSTSPDAGFRFAIDRAFTLPGIGTVVTGTIMSGTVQVGDKLILTPHGASARVRSLHAQNRPATSARPGVRCAIAISGPLIEKDGIKRGDMLVAPPLHAPAERIGACLTFSEGVSVRNGGMVQLYHGAGATSARLRVVNENASDRRQLVELMPVRPVAVLYGDRILLRDEVRKANVAGGIVVDPFLPDDAASRLIRSDRLKAASRKAPADALDDMIETFGFADFARFCRARNLAPETVRALEARFADALTGTGNRAMLLSRRARDGAKQRLVDGLADYHATHQEVIGPRKEHALAMMGRQFAAAAAEACLAEAVAEGHILLDAACVRLASHKPHLSPDDRRIWVKLQDILDAAGLRPPHLGEVAEAFALPPEDMQDRLYRLEQFGLITHATKRRFFLPAALEQFRVLADELMEQSDGDGFTAADFNKKSGIGRNLTIEVLEYLDRTGVTKRQGLRRRML